MMASAVLLGSIPLAAKVLRLLIATGVSPVAVVCERQDFSGKHDPFLESPVAAIADAYHIPVVSPSQLTASYSHNELDFAISCRAPYILSKEFLSLFSTGVVNLHGGLLPEFRGTNIANVTILEGATVGGATLHLMDEGIDTGPIIAERTFPVGPLDTAHDVFLATQLALWHLVLEHLSNIISGQFSTTDQASLSSLGRRPRYFSKSYLEEKRYLDVTATPDEICRAARAFSFPGHPAAELRLSHGRTIAISPPHRT